jgi:PAS domain S-box-containing protein
MNKNNKSEKQQDSTPQNEFILGKGKMAELVHSMDWSKTPLGPIEEWPQSLKTTVSLCLASNFPISIAWGPERVQIYNDGYWPLTGDKHPTSMGQDYKECWYSAWPVLGEAFEQASAGQTRFLENQRMFLDRFGYLEETFFTFSFSPIRDESGGVGGLFHPVTDLTQQTLVERRLTILRTVADRTVNAKTVEEASFLVLDTLKEFELDLPFVLLYSLTADGKEATLEGSVGMEAHTSLAPAKMNLDIIDIKSNKGWPLADVIQSGRSIQVNELEKEFGTFTSGPYPEPPKTALVHPVYLPGREYPHYLLVAGVSARRSLDEKYLLFYDLLIGTITNALTKARTYEEERKRAEALAELDRAKTTFFSNISHEFRTPLTLILGPLEDSLSDKNNPLQKEQQERLELVQRNTLRLQRLVNSLLDFSRIESGRLKASYHAIDLASYTGELASVFRSAMEKAGLNFQLDCQPISAPVFIDPDMWEKIVFNLLSNALKFTFEGKVEVSLTEEKGKVLLKVSDTGEGIPKEELANLFKRFYRIQGTKSRTHEGSGIGLAFVQELVKIHGGTISAESEIHKGTAFTVSIPTGSAHLPKDRIVPEKTGDLKLARSNVFINESMQWVSDINLQSSEDLYEAVKDNVIAHTANILVVDDNTDMLEYVIRILSKNKNWKIQAAGDRLQALEAIDKQKPDLVLSDVMMPQMDGFHLMKKLRDDPDTSRIPVIFLSARAGEEATLEGLEKGADDYLVKPFSARELIARVRTQLEITHTRQDNTLLREAEEELRKFRIISDYAFDAFILMREDGTFAYLNDLALKRWGYTKEESLHIRVPDVDPIYQEDKFKEAFALAQKQYISPFETIHKRKDGTTYPVEISMGGIILDGKPHMFAVARDITERKLAEETLKARNEELQKTNNDLDNFIYTASHDLKAPITNIEGLMHMLVRHLPAESLEIPVIDKVITMTRASVDRFKNTINDLTELTKLQRSTEDDVSQVQFSEIFEEIRLDLETTIQDSGAKLETNFSQCPSFRFSRKNLRSIIYNLVSNAIKYHSPEREPFIRVSSKVEQEFCMLTVEDNGLGIDLSQESKLFSMFKRLHDHVEGSGIGLYIVKKIVENSGGKIKVESEVGKGSTFRVHLKCNNLPFPSRDKTS